jgi:hypothetical protein
MKRIILVSLVGALLGTNPLFGAKTLKEFIAALAKKRPNAELVAIYVDLPAGQKAHAVREAKARKIDIDALATTARTQQQQPQVDVAAMRRADQQAAQWIKQLAARNVTEDLIDAATKFHQDNQFVLSPNVFDQLNVAIVTANTVLEAAAQIPAAPAVPAFEEGELVPEVPTLTSEEMRHSKATAEKTGKAIKEQEQKEQKQKDQNQFNKAAIDLFTKFGKNKNLTAAEMEAELNELGGHYVQFINDSDNWKALAQLVNNKKDEEKAAKGKLEALQQRKLEEQKATVAQEEKKKKAEAPAIKQPAQSKADQQADALIKTLTSSDADAMDVQDAQALLANKNLSARKAQELQAAMKKLEDAQQEKAKETKQREETSATASSVYAGSSAGAVSTPPTIPQKEREDILKVSKVEQKKIEEQIAREQRGKKAATLSQPAAAVLLASTPVTAANAQTIYESLSKVAESLGALETDAQKTQAKALLPFLKSDDDKNTVQGWLVGFEKPEEKKVAATVAASINTPTVNVTAANAQTIYESLSKVAESLGALETDAQKTQAKALLPFLKSDDDKNTVRGWL